MMNLNKVSMKLDIIDSVVWNVDSFNTSIQKQATSVFFNNFTSHDLDRFLKESGFEQIENLKLFYFKKVNDFILIIKLESRHIKEKYLIHYTEDNFAYIKDTKNYEQSFESFHNDEKRNHTLYPEGVSTPFFENFMVMENYGDPTLIRTDVGFKYLKNRFVIASLYEKHKKQIQICYDDYSHNPDCILADSIGFIGQELTDVKILSTKSGKRISLLDHKDVFDISGVTIENFHLFWERYTQEEQTLLAMLLI